MDPLTVDTGTLLKAIISGGFDSDLDRLYNAVTGRRRILAEYETADLSIGDRVIATADVRPRILACQTGVVIGRAGERIIVHWDRQVGRLAGDWSMSKGSLKKESHDV